MRNPQHFRSQMAKYEALVSGSVALQLFERVVWKESDLDVFTRWGTYAGEFGLYLIEEEGYKLEKTTRNHGYMMPDIHEVS